MKFSTIFASVLLVCCCSGALRAQTVTLDSLAADSVLAPFSAVNENLALGLPDTKQAHLTSGGQIVLEFMVNKHPIPMQKGALIHLYWLRESPDSNAAQVQFFEFNNDLIPLMTGPIVFVPEGGALNVRNMTTLTVPDDGYNAIQISTAGDITGGATSFYLDAAVLVQHIVAGVKSSDPAPVLMSSYPNPFAAAEGTTLRVTVPESGSASVEVRDVLGREVMELPLGYLTQGEQELKVMLGRQGAFVARLKVNGNFVGAPLKLSAE